MNEADPERTVTRCAWVTNDPLYVHYHDHEWGVPVYDDRLLFEFLILGGAQAGLNWLTILKKRDNYRHCFDGFDPLKIARYKKQKVDALIANPGIIRNRLKIASVIENAKAYLKVTEEHGSFKDYIWCFVGGQPIQNHWHSHQEVLGRTPASDQMSRDLKKEGLSL